MGFLDDVDTVIPGAKNGIDTVGDMVQGAVLTATTAVGGAVETATSVAGGAIETAVNVVGDVVEDLADKVAKLAADQMLKFIKEYVMKLWEIWKLTFWLVIFPILVVMSLFWCYGFFAGPIAIFRCIGKRRDRYKRFHESSEPTLGAVANAALRGKRAKKPKRYRHDEWKVLVGMLDLQITDGKPIFSESEKPSPQNIDWIDAVETYRRKWQDRWERTVRIVLLKQEQSPVQRLRRRLRHACEKEAKIRSRVGLFHGFLPNPREWWISFYRFLRTFMRVIRNCINWLFAEPSVPKIPEEDPRDLPGILLQVLDRHKYRHIDRRLIQDAQNTFRDNLNKSKAFERGRGWRSSSDGTFKLDV